ncbi:MAG: hypothetical protein IGR93_11760 [Hydrococcus sp. C42_A2020_068]|nr:hypothetical protein [Pleurocapsa sp. PCC 7327]AFY79137.1 hypothetical protein Ple7327_3994 [Pleurocapsa sp. PCC 7327]MBF2020750.1 hypothetical protein [Hydrococcus sp. C42_A2020_068]
MPDEILRKNLPENALISIVCDRKVDANPKNYLNAIASQLERQQHLLTI